MRGGALSVVVPTRNEAGNVVDLARRLDDALDDGCGEIVFVDDSDDDTPERIGAIREPRVRLIHRPRGQRHGGLGGAVATGLDAARGTWVCVMDADLQHPPEAVPDMLERARRRDVDVVVASRFRSARRWRPRSRLRGVASYLFITATKALFPWRLRGVSDPMSGFFLLRRAAVDPRRLRPRGFKVLLEILARHRGLRRAEVGFDFGARRAGHSKAGLREATRLLGFLAILRVGARRLPTFHDYDLHGLIGVRSEQRLPELEPFRVDSLGTRPTISVGIGRVRPRASAGSTDLVYRERPRRLAFGVRIGPGEEGADIVASPLLRRSPHVLYTNVVEPVLRWTFVRRGYALVHGACFERDGRAFLVTAKTDTGKTTTMLRLLDARGSQPGRDGEYGFLSDDLTLVSPDGVALTYPKPLTISRHTLEALGDPDLRPRERATLALQSRLHSRSGRRIAFLLARLRLPAASLNAVVQLLVPPPKYPVERLVRGVRTARRAMLEGMFVIERGSETEQPLEDGEALDVLLENCEDAYGFPPYPQVAPGLYTRNGTDLRPRERAIVRSALGGRPAMRLGSSTMGWAERIPVHVEDILRRAPAAELVQRTTPERKARGAANTSAGRGAD